MSRQVRGECKEEHRKTTLRALRLCLKKKCLAKYAENAKKNREKPFACFASLRETNKSRQERGERQEEHKKTFAYFASLREIKTENPLRALRLCVKKQEEISAKALIVFQL